MIRVGFRTAVAAAILCLSEASHAQTQIYSVPERPLVDLTPKSYFIDERGVPILTNRPERFRRDPRYKEVEIVFEPIVIPERYRSPSNSTSDFEGIVEEVAQRYGIDRSLILAVIAAESSFDPYAVSEKGARGLMQLMPGTAAEMGVRDPFDPYQNVAGGTQYLAKLLEIFNDDLDLALAAYNAGPTTVNRYDGVPPYPETRAYIRNVKKFRRKYEGEPMQLAMRLPRSRPGRDYLPNSEHAYVVTFRSGTTQPADSVEEMAPYYVVTYRGRQFTVRQDLVTEIRQTE